MRDCSAKPDPGLAYPDGSDARGGHGHRSAEEIAEAIEDIGGAMEVGSTGASLRVRAEDLPLAIEWLADLAIRPTFPAEALTWARRKTAAELQSDRDDPAFRADLIFRGLVYGDHPYARDPRGAAREIARLTRDDVIDHHRRYFTPETPSWWPSATSTRGSCRPWSRHTSATGRRPEIRPRRSPGWSGPRDRGSAGLRFRESRSIS